MMPVVRINDATFGDLKAIAAWFGTKTPSETIDRIVKNALDELGLERDTEADEPASVSPDGAMEFETAPPLAFTKPLAASIGGKSVQSPRWSSILLKMIAHLKAKGYEGADLVRELRVPAKTGKYEDEGFKFHPDLGISVQGQSAPDAWKEIDRIADKLQVPVSIEFWWRQNPKAHFPGRTGRLRSGGTRL